jgi:hypothetical protein
MAAASIAVTSALPAFAQSRGGGVPIVRDAEIEALVADYAAPILKAAGLGGRGVRVILVNSPSFNAFVDGRRIFINTGAIMQAETPNEIIGGDRARIGPPCRGPSGAPSRTIEPCPQYGDHRDAAGRWCGCGRCCKR